MRFIVSILLCSSLSLLARTWTDVKGRTLEGEFIELKGDVAVVQLDKGEKVVNLPMAKLSETDQEWIKEHVAELKAKKGNWEEEWPKEVRAPDEIEIEIISENLDEKQFVYHSAHYEFVCDVKLSKTVVGRFAKLFEATFEYCKALPINTRRAHISGTDDKHRIFLFEEKEDYIKNGGPPESAGVYIENRRGNKIMVPLTSLGVQKVGSSYMIDHKKSNDTLSHEITHQLMDSEYDEAGGWFVEGLAEYVSNTPYRNGRFNVKSNLRAIKEAATSFNKEGFGANLGEDLDAPDLEGFMKQSYRSFTSEARFNYAFGMLLTTYFFHMDDEGSRENIVSYLKALKEGERNRDALLILLAGRSWDELEASISKEWKSKGVRIEFR